MTLPPITKDHVHQQFGQVSPEPNGPGAVHMLEARDPWNEGDYDKAFDLLSKAVDRGVNGSWLSTAHSQLGQIHVRRRDLLGAVEHFLRCLAIQDRDSGDTWQSAMRLYYIYAEAGRTDEAAAVRSLAGRANEFHRWAHTPTVEAECRNLVRLWLSGA